MVRFHAVHEKLSQALDGLPDELCISDEVKEQVYMSFFFFFWLAHAYASMCCFIVHLD